VAGSVILVRYIRLIEAGQNSDNQLISLHYQIQDPVIKKGGGIRDL